MKLSDKLQFVVAGGREPLGRLATDFPEAIGRAVGIFLCNATTN